MYRITAYVFLFNPVGLNAEIQLWNLTTNFKIAFQISCKVNNNNNNVSGLIIFLGQYVEKA